MKTVVYPQKYFTQEWVSAQGVSTQGGCVSQHAMGQMPPLWTDRHLLIHNLRKLRLGPVLGKYLTYSFYRCEIIIFPPKIINITQCLCGQQNKSIFIESTAYMGKGTTKLNFPLHPVGTSVNSAVFENLNNFCLLHYEVSQ